MIRDTLSLLNIVPVVAPSLGHITRLNMCDRRSIKIKTGRAWKRDNVEAEKRQGFTISLSAGQ